MTEPVSRFSKEEPFVIVEGIRKETASSSSDVEPDGPSKLLVEGDSKCSDLCCTRETFSAGGDRKVFSCGRIPRCSEG